MNNYYEACIQKIEQALNQHNYEEAIQLLEEELRMPYIPEMYLKKLQSLKKEIPMPENPKSPLFYEVDEIENALIGNPQQQIKALTSLEMMNIRLIWDTYKQWLISPYYDDRIKKQLLLISLGQGINDTIDTLIDQKLYTLNLSELEHPMNSKAYQKCLQEIRDKLESDNPSLLILCQQLLEMEVVEDFPFVKEKYEAQMLIDTVDSYMNQKISTQ